PEIAGFDSQRLLDRHRLGQVARLRHHRKQWENWADCTTPFTWFEHGRALATVGVLEHPVRLAGSDTVIAGIHAVCTDPDHRGRGLCRRLMQAAVEWAAPRFPLMELSTGSPPVYRSAGFTLVRTYRFAARPVGGAPTPVRPMNLD